MQKIFISYSRKDIDFVRKLAGDLESAGYDVWWDITDLSGGDDWVRVIPEAIKSSQYVIVVLTPDSIESDWVRKEYTQALSLRKKIIPILLAPSSIPFALNTINFVNFAVGEYADNFKKLLPPLGYTDEPPVVAPYKKALISLPVVKYGIPAVAGLLLLLAFIFIPGNTPPAETPTVTSTPTIAASSTYTATPETFTPTNTATNTATETKTFTPTSPSTFTLTATPEAFSLPICIYIIDANANVREGPSTDYDILGKLDTDGTKCPLFSARITNEDKQVWFQFALDQKAEFQKYAGNWISGSSLAAFDLPKPLPLPICVDNSADIVYAHILPSMNEEQQGSPLKADGTNCPFFSTRKENSEGIWYQFSPNQKGNVEFQQYAGGWIHEDSLVVYTFNLPVVTLTPTSTPSNIPTITPSPAPSSTPTITPSPTATNTFTSTPTNTPTPTTTFTETPTETPIP